MGATEFLIQNSEDRYPDLLGSMVSRSGTYHQFDGGGDHFLPDSDRLGAYTTESFKPAAIRSLAKTFKGVHAIANGVFIVAVNRTGTEDQMKFWGGSFIADPFGNFTFSSWS